MSDIQGGDRGGVPSGITPAAGIQTKTISNLKSSVVSRENSHAHGSRAVSRTNTRGDNGGTKHSLPSTSRNVTKTEFINTSNTDAAKPAAHIGNTRLSSQEKASPRTGAERARTGAERERTPGASSLLRQPTLSRARSDLIRETITKLEDLQEGIDTISHKTIPEVEEVLERTSTYYKTEMGSEHASTPEDDRGVQRYESTCRRLGVNALCAVKRQLGTDTIKLVNLGLNPRDTLALCNNLLNRTDINELILEGNRLGEVGSQYVASLLVDSVSITSVVLTNNMISSNGVADIADMLEYNSVITSLNISGNLIKDRDVDHVARMLENNRCLTHLDLSHNSLGDAACQTLGYAIGVNESIRTLDLSWNKIRPKGAKALCAYLKDNFIMKSLLLSMNGFSSEGAKALGAALNANTTLTEVDVSHNRISDDGVLYLAKALQVNEQLISMKLQSNPITSRGGYALLIAISRNENTKMQQLNLSTVCLTPASVEIYENIRNTIPQFTMVYEGTSRADAVREERQHNDFSSKKPFAIMKEYMDSQNLRMIDFFKQMDKDGGGSISREEFVQGLQSIKVPLSESQLDELLKELDTDGDGEVDYGELVSAEKEFRLKARMRKLKTS